MLTISSVEAVCPSVRFARHLHQSGIRLLHQSAKLRRAYTSYPYVLAGIYAGPILHSSSRRTEMSWQEVCHYLVDPESRQYHPAGISRTLAMATSILRGSRQARFTISVESLIDPGGIEDKLALGVASVRFSQPYQTLAWDGLRRCMLRNDVSVITLWQS